MSTVITEGGDKGTPKHTCVSGEKRSNTKKYVQNKRNVLSQGFPSSDRPVRGYGEVDGVRATRQDAFRPPVIYP